MQFVEPNEARFSRLEAVARYNRFRFILDSPKALFKIVNDVRAGKLDKESVLRFLKA